MIMATAKLLVNIFQLSHPLFFVNTQKGKQNHFNGMFNYFDSKLMHQCV